MKKHLEIRNMLAEQGTEKTPEEAKTICKGVTRLMKRVTHDRYLMYLSMSEQDMQENADQLEVPLEEFKECREILLQIGRHKFEL